LPATEYSRLELREPQQRWTYCRWILFSVQK